MDKTFDTRSDFHECAKIDKPFDSPFKDIPFRMGFDEAVKRTFLCLFERNVDYLLLKTDNKNLNIHFVSDIHSIFDFFDSAVAQFVNMCKPVNFTEIDECTESRD